MPARLTGAGSGARTCTAIFKAAANSSRLIVGGYPGLRYFCLSFRLKGNSRRRSQTAEISGGLRAEQAFAMFTPLIHYKQSMIRVYKLAFCTLFCNFVHDFFMIEEKEGFFYKFFPHAAIKLHSLRCHMFRG